MSKTQEWIMSLIRKELAGLPNDQRMALVNPVMEDMATEAESVTLDLQSILDEIADSYEGSDDEKFEAMMTQTFAVLGSEIEPA